MRDALVVFVTAPNEETAVKVARCVVEEKLAACVNIVSNVRSIYRWQGKIEDESELLLVIKTRQERFKALRERVKALHTYTVPEIIALPVTDGLEEYLAWLKEETA